MKKKHSLDSSSTDSIDKEIQDVEQKCTESKKQRLMPKIREFRARAHKNPFTTTQFPYPLNPDFVDWRIHFPNYYNGKQELNYETFGNTNEHPITYGGLVQPEFNGSQKSVDFLDVGCGYGGLLFSLSKKFPSKLIFGLEIRNTAINYIVQKIKAVRIEQNECFNVGAIRTNAMRHTTQYFRRASVEKMFFCFPDPHFKQKNKRKRIINTGLLSEYAYIMKPKARIYCITDVLDLHQWHTEKLAGHNQFKVLTQEELQDDVCLELIHNTTEESKKVDRKAGDKYYIVAERI